MIHTSHIEISESAIKNNLTFIRNLIGEKVELSSVVKGNAYGHGISTYCRLAFKHGVRHFSVSDAVEAVDVLKSLRETDISLMIMAMIDNDAIEWAIEHGVAFYVFEFDRLKFAQKIAHKIGIPAKIHLEIETGMNRTGLSQKELNDALKFIKDHASDFILKGICTHLAGAESIANYKRITDQQKKFNRITTNLANKGMELPTLHMASSAATIRYPKTRFDLVRVGIMQYGFFPTQEILVHYLSKNKIFESPLKRVVSWKTKVMDTNLVPTGNFIGYGTSYFTNKDTRIAIIPVGYSSGYNRSLSNRGKVLIKGKRLDVIGTVNMNMTAIDITSCPEIKKGDEVVLIGNQGEKEIGVSSFSDFSQVINYELLTRLPHKIPRIVVE